MNNQDIINIIKAERDELEACMRYWMNRSIDMKLKKADRKAAKENWESYVKRVVAVEGVLAKVERAVDAQADALISQAVAEEVDRATDNFDYIFDDGHDAQTEAENLS